MRGYTYRYQTFDRSKETWTIEKVQAWNLWQTRGNTPLRRYRHGAFNRSEETWTIERIQVWNLWQIRGNMIPWQVRGNIYEPLRGYRYEIIDRGKEPLARGLEPEERHETINRGEYGMETLIGVRNYPGYIQGIIDRWGMQPLTKQRYGTIERIQVLNHWPRGMESLMEKRYWPLIIKRYGQFDEKQETHLSLYHSSMYNLLFNNHVKIVSGQSGFCFLWKYFLNIFPIGHFKLFPPV